MRSDQRTVSKVRDVLESSNMTFISDNFVARRCCTPNKFREKIPFADRRLNFGHLRVENGQALQTHLHLCRKRLGLDINEGT